jgi:hypothetical protein
MNHSSEDEDENKYQYNALCSTDYKTENNFFEDHDRGYNFFN